MSYKKYFNDYVYRNELKASKLRSFIVLLERVDVIAEVWMYFLILFSRYSFYIITPRLNVK